MMGKHFKISQQEMALEYYCYSDSKVTGKAQHQENKESISSTVFDCVKFIQMGNHAGLQAIYLAASGELGYPWRSATAPLVSNLQTIAACPTQIWVYQVV